MPIIDDLGRTMKTQRELRGEGYEVFYKRLGRGKNWGWRLENPSAICPNTGRPYGSPLGQKPAKLLDSLGLTVAVKSDSGACVADLITCIDAQDWPEREKWLLHEFALLMGRRVYREREEAA